MGGGFGWVVASGGIGGVVAYSVTRPPVIITTPPVVYVQPQTVIAPSSPPIGYHWERILDGSCNCYRLVLAPGA